MSAGLGGAAGPVVEGGDGAGGAREVLETAPGGTPWGAALYHAHLPTSPSPVTAPPPSPPHQDVPFPLAGPTEGEGDLGLV